MRATYSYIGMRIIFFVFLVVVVMVESFAPSKTTTIHSNRSTLCIRRKDQAPPFHKRSSSCASSSPSRNTRGVHGGSCISGHTTLAMSSPLSAATCSSILSSLHANNSFVLSALLVLSVCGIAMEQKTTIGKALSANLVTMLTALCLANLRVIPFNSPVYKLVNQVLVPLAVPLFLFDSDFKRVVRDAGSLLVAFLVGALSTVVGTLCAFTLIPLKSLGEQGWQVACALTSRHIGGAINFVAVADTLNIDGSIVSAAIAADNVVVALYFAFLFYLATPTPGKAEKHNNKTANENAKDTVTTSKSESLLSEEIALPGEEPIPITTSSIAYSIATASCLVTLGSAITAAVCPGLSSLVITSLLTVISATVFPRWFHQLRTSGIAIGVLFLQMFFAASGAGGSLLLVIRQAPSLIAFSALQLAIHFLVLMGVGRGVLRLDLNELLLASNANVGGPTTAAAMAQAKEWQKLVLPALLVGVLGYATATALSLSLGPILIRLAAR
ncbi:hypothetical protein ACHAXR_008456 [Thalassiosira sp. AJA248-18]